MNIRPLFPDITVNGKMISAADIAAEAQHHTAPADKPGLAWRKAARALIVRQLCLETAAAKGLSSGPVEIEPGRFEIEAEATIRTLLEAEIVPEPVSDSAVMDYYNTHSDRMRAPDLFEASHILFTVPEGLPQDDTSIMDRAEAALQQLLRNPKSFAELAREHSDCPSRDNGGFLGQLISGDTVPEFERLMRIAKVGEIHPELLVTRFGVHILRLDARVCGRPLPFESVEAKIREAFEKDSWVRAAGEYTSRLIDNANIEGIDKKALRPQSAAA